MSIITILLGILFGVISGVGLSLLISGFLVGRSTTVGDEKGEYRHYAKEPLHIIGREKYAGKSDADFTYMTMCRAKAKAMEEQKSN